MSDLVSEMYIPSDYMRVPEIQHMIHIHNWSIIPSEIREWVMVRKRRIYQDWLPLVGMLITFFYKIASKIYYGKYIGSMRDNYDDGLDIVVRDLIYPTCKTAYSLESETDVVVGIISYQRNGYDYFSENEKNIFDMLYCNWSNQPVEIFVNGIQVKI